MKHETITHRFVENIPNTIDEGVLYISIPYTTALHRCCCGCGNEVVTPLSPVDWQLSFDGLTVSLSPSIGNWGFPCQSHYWIRRNKVQWARRWNRHEINVLRNQEAREHAEFFATKDKQNTSSRVDPWLRIRRWFDTK